MTPQPSGLVMFSNATRPRHPELEIIASTLPPPCLACQDSARRQRLRRHFMAYRTQKTISHQIISRRPQSRRIYPHLPTRDAYPLSSYASSVRIARTPCSGTRLADSLSLAPIASPPASIVMNVGSDAARTPGPPSLPGQMPTKSRAVRTEKEGWLTAPIDGQRTAEGVENMIGLPSDRAECRRASP